MRQRDAERAARKFIAKNYPDMVDWHFNICRENDGERAASWSFAVQPDEEDVVEEPYSHETYLVGYVHADGTLEGLY